MDKEAFVELIEEKKELDQNSDSDIEKQIFEQQMSVRNPNIPESLKTPENSQKNLIKLHSKINHSRLILDNDSPIDINSEINDSKNSFNNDSLEKKIKRRQKHSITHSYFKGKNSSKSVD